MSVIWTFISNGRELKLTELFYIANNATALFHGPEARFNFYYDNPEGFYTFVINITGAQYSRVTRADDGVYRCSLTNGDTLLDSKEVKLTVLNPVESVSIEIHDAEHNIIASSKKAVTKNATQVNLTPGQYMVKCDASGSNPKPVMHLLLNDEKPHVSTTTMKDKNAVFTSYRGSFTVDSLKVNAHNALQTLTCLANIPGDYYPSAEAGLALMA
ncbi:uncharacterized protein LOC128552968, partial [Mercenaria mercenaria]|uniref:uncharacterized protein LOC128552968 n=1 Tax=Mercenaria mercenaria TaxID=6596 RepID=UPI00234FA392